MAVTCETVTNCHDKDNRSHEEAKFLEALKNCDDETFCEIISILKAKGLLPA